MRVKVVARCGPRCGLRVEGEVETASREFIHRFRVPRGAEALLSSPQTEVEEMRLVTFAPDARQWLIECPLCRASIRIPGPEPPQAERA